MNSTLRFALAVAADDGGAIRFCGFKGRYRLSWRTPEGLSRTRIVRVGEQ